MLIPKPGFFDFASLISFTEYIVTLSTLQLVISFLLSPVIPPTCLPPAIVEFFTVILLMLSPPSQNPASPPVFCSKAELLDTFISVFSMIRFSILAGSPTQPNSPNAVYVSSLLLILTSLIVCPCPSNSPSNQYDSHSPSPFFLPAIGAISSTSLISSITLKVLPDVFAPVSGPFVPFTALEKPFSPGTSLMV